jgi:branched-chain amino acid transport system permease protein
MVILGGRRSIPGALLGAAAIVLIQEVFGNAALFGDGARHWPLVLGGGFLAAALWRRSGMAGSGPGRR